MKWPVSALLLFVVCALAASCINDDELEYKRAYTAGAIIYQQHCQNCHGSKGEGLSALMPPLTDSVYLKQNKTQLACMLKYGIDNKLIIVNGKPYQNQMPPANLAPVEIAQVLTYIKNSFGNHLGSVTTSQVNHALLNCK